MHMELSEFESTATTHALGPRHRVANPLLIVKKYRRSAAGGGVSSQSSAARGAARSIDDLVTTIDHLLGYFLPSQSVYSHDVMGPRSLAACVSFIDDRIRSVQVDLTTSLLDPHRTLACWAKIRTLQAKCVRYGILISYLLCDLPPTKYEAKFGKTALRTAIDSYFAAWDASYGSSDGSGSNGGIEPTNGELDVRDEMLSYEALMHVAEGLKKRESALPTYDASSGAEGGFGAVLVSYLGRGGLRDVPGRTKSKDDVPDLVREDGSNVFHEGTDCLRSKRRLNRWSTALQVAAAADQDNFIRMFRLLGSCDESADSTSSDSSWSILSRCCLVPAINVVRIGLVRRYNKSFGKLEKISGDDLARLLWLPSPSAAVQFCSDVGLPTEDDKIVMKAMPISITEKEAVKRMTNPGRNEDTFAFGKDMLVSWSLDGSDSRESIDSCRNKPSSLASAAGAAKSSLASASKSSLSSLAAASKPQKQSSLAAAVVTPSNPSPRSSPAAKRWGDDSGSDEDDWENAADKLEIESGKKDAIHMNSASSRIDQDGTLVPPGHIICDIIC